MSSVVLYRKKSKVVHLGVWAMNAPADDMRTGRYVPICGQDNGNRWTPTAAQYGWDPEARSRPMCSRCVATAETLTAYAKSEPWA